MDNIIEIKIPTEQEKTVFEEKELRLLGYYNEPDQQLSDESEEPEKAIRLADLLSKTFDSTDDPNDDAAFKDAVQNGVFILRDKESKLYAYFHKEHKARVNGVLFNRNGLFSLPMEYKTWFTPGKKLSIAPLGSVSNISAFQNASFFDYMRQPDRIGKHIVLATDYLSSKGAISGELVAVGRDFLSITDSQGQSFVISNHMCIQLNLPLLQLPKENVTLLQQEVAPMGYIKSYDPKKGHGWVVSYEGGQLGLSGTSLLDPKLHEGSQVVYTLYNGKKMAYANYVHSPGSVDDILRLAQQLRRQKKTNEATEVLKHILDEFPDHPETNAMLQELTKKDNSQGKSAELDSDTLEFNRANEIMESGGNRAEAIEVYMQLLSRDKKVKDCVLRIAEAYFALYNEADDPEEKAIQREKLLEHIKKNYTKLSPSAQMNFLLINYMKLREDDKYYQIIDEELDKTELHPDNQRRGRMLYFKAFYMSQSNSEADDERASELAEESLFLAPFNNKAELLWLPAKEYIGETPSVPKGRCSYSQALLRQGLLMNVDDKNDWMGLLNQANKYSFPAEYAELLIGAVVSGRAVNKANQDISDQLLTEYISLKAQSLAAKGEIESAVFLWSELFSIVPGMGYFVQVNLSAMMSAVLNKGIGDVTGSVYSPWQDVLINAKNITRQQWEYMLYAMVTNQQVIDVVGKYVSDNAQLAAAWESLTNTTGYEGSLQEVATDLSLRTFEESAASKLSELHKNVPELSEKLTALSMADFSRTPFMQLSISDQNRLGKLTDDCRPLINQYLLMDNVKDRLEKSDEIKMKLKTMADAIMKKPTWFSINGLLPLINSINANIDRVADNFTEYTKPQIRLTITSEYVSKDDDGYYHITGQINNAKDAGDASDLNLTIKSKKNISKVKVPTIPLGTLMGGQERVFYFDTMMSVETEKKALCGFSISCTYTYKGKKYEQQFNPLQVNLGQAPEFSKIETQPYTYGPAINFKDPTFKGRSEDINEIIDFVMHPQRPSAQIIVYGQKRCGKSTLVKAVKYCLDNEYSDKAFCVYLTLSPEKNRNGRVYSEADFYYTLLSTIEEAVLDAQGPKIIIPIKEDIVTSDTPAKMFSDVISAFKKKMAATPGWEHRRLVVIIDEFTRLYTCIKDGWASDSILHNWKALQESGNPANFATIFVGHDITPKFFNEKYARNATDNIERRLIGYIDKQSACELIERPIWDKVNDCSRFTHDAIDRIIYYTACNPSYLQIFMRRIVEYINANKRVKVSRQDVEVVANGFITKQFSEFENIGKFDNLINSGIDDRFTDFTDHQFEIVLRIIARLTKDTLYCKRSAVEESVFALTPNEENSGIMKSLDAILDDLNVRKVIDRINDNEEIRIIIGIFKEWLINN